LPPRALNGFRFASVAWIESPSVSRRHARILVSGETATLEDLGSRNGTFLGGDKIAAPSPLADGDEIRIGHAFLTFRSFPAAASTKPDPGP
jgi:pSer/pThr/pTyr-binding forkhead associated (FHA) protein